MKKTRVRRGSLEGFRHNGFTIFILVCCFSGLAVAQNFNVGQTSTSWPGNTVANYTYVDANNVSPNTGTVQQIVLVPDLTYDGVNDSVWVGTCYNSSGDRYDLRGSAGLSVSGTFNTEVTFTAGTDFVAFEVQTGDAVCKFSPSADPVQIRRSNDNSGTFLKYEQTAGDNIFANDGSQYVVADGLVAGGDEFMAIKFICQTAGGDEFTFEKYEPYPRYKPKNPK